MVTFVSSLLNIILIGRFPPLLYRKGRLKEKETSIEPSISDHHGIIATNILVIGSMIGRGSS